MTNRILLIGIRPSALDYSKLPGLDETTFTARIDAAMAAVNKAGFDPVICQVDPSPDEAVAEVRKHLAADAFDVAMIGAGIRNAPEHTMLLEHIVNALVSSVPGITFCFNTSPEDTVDALRRATED